MVLRYDFISVDYSEFRVEKVKLSKRIHAKDAWSGDGERGLATVVKDDGNVFHIHRQSYLFNSLSFRSIIKL